MKLPIKKKYFDEIKSGYKIHEYRDAHITFVCEETGEELRKDLVGVELIKRHPNLFPDVLEDDKVILFSLKIAPCTS